eukprot:413030-Rhodomonas_salina.2
MRSFSSDCVSGATNRTTLHVPPTQTSGSSRRASVTHAFNAFRRGGQRRTSPGIQKAASAPGTGPPSHHITSLT